MIFNDKIICNQYGIPLSAHSLNLPVMCFENWPEDSSGNLNMSPSF